MAEIRAYPDELQTFLVGVFDRLDHLADGLFAQEVAAQHAERHAFQGQIERLASVASELAAAVAEQKKLVDQKKKPRDRAEG